MLAVEIAAQSGRTAAQPLIEALRQGSGWRAATVSQKVLEAVAADKSDGRDLGVASVSWTRSDLALALLLLVARLEYDGSTRGELFRSLGILPGEGHRLATKLASENREKGLWPQIAAIAVLDALEPNLGVVRYEADRATKRYPREPVAYLVARQCWMKGSESRTHPELNHPSDEGKGMRMLKRAAELGPTMATPSWLMAFHLRENNPRLAQRYAHTFLTNRERAGRPTDYERRKFREWGILPP